MKKLFCIVLFFLTFIVNSQNLVPNWSFETYTACPTSGNQVYYAPPWFGPTMQSSDYYNSCATIGSGLNVPVNTLQYAKDGNAFAAIYLLNGVGSYGYREYLQTKLIDSLKNGTCYYVEFYANLYNGNRYATNNVAANFSSMAYPTNFTSAYTMTALNVPQHITQYGNPIIKDTVNWVKISGIYQAGGWEKYITLGNFKDNPNTDTLRFNPSAGNSAAYYFFDAVSVYSINPTGILPWTYRDTTVAIGDSVYIGNTMGGTFTSNWYTYGGTFINSGSDIYVKPVTTSTYVVQFTVCGVPRSDTLKVTVTRVGINELRFKNDELRISPNPNNGLLNIDISNKEFTLENSEIKITNVLGQEIKNFKLQTKKQKLDLTEIESGIYYLQLMQGNKVVVSKKIIKE